MTSFIDRIKTALAEHDTRMKSCPVSNPIRGRFFAVNDICPLCQAKASGTCGLSSNAGFHLAESIRFALKSEEEA